MRWGVAVSMCVVVLAGCGSGGKSPATVSESPVTNGSDMIDMIAAALDKARAVHVFGTWTAGGSVSRIDARLQGREKQVETPRYGSSNLRTWSARGLIEDNRAETIQRLCGDGVVAAV